MFHETFRGNLQMHTIHSIRMGT